MPLMKSFIEEELASNNFQAVSQKLAIMKMKVESEKVGLRLSIQKMKIMASGPFTSWEMGKQSKYCQTLFFGAPKSVQMVTAAMKLKDAYSLEGKL